MSLSVSNIEIVIDGDKTGAQSYIDEMHSDIPLSISSNNDVPLLSSTIRPPAPTDSPPPPVNTNPMSYDTDTSMATVLSDQKDEWSYISGDSSLRYNAAKKEAGEVASQMNKMAIDEVDKEVFQSLLDFGKRPICVCGRELQAMKSEFVRIYFKNILVDDDPLPPCNNCGEMLQSISLRNDYRKDKQTNGNDTATTTTTANPMKRLMRTMTLFSMPTIETEDLVWCCPSKLIYPHIDGFFLCHKCCVAQMLSNRWVDQCGSTYRLLTFVVSKLELEPSKNVKKCDESWKIIGETLFERRQAELSDAFADLYNLRRYQSLLTNICGLIVDYECRKYDDNFFPYILSMTAWTEIRTKLSRFRFDWTLYRSLWKSHIQPCCENVCSTHCESQFSRIEFLFVGSIKYHYSILIRYIHFFVAFIISYHLIISEVDTFFLTIVVWIGISFTIVDCVIGLFVHWFRVRPKCKIMQRLDFITQPQSVLQAIIAEDTLAFCLPMPSKLTSVFELISTLDQISSLFLLKNLILILLYSIHLQYPKKYVWIVLWILTGFVSTYVIYVSIRVKRAAVEPENISFQVSFIGTIAMVTLLSLSYIPTDWLWMFAFLLPLALFCSANVCLLLLQMWIFVIMAIYARVNLMSGIGFLVFFVEGFLLIEFENRRILLNERWTQYRLRMRWVRCCGDIVTMLFKICCIGGCDTC